ncbi:MAG: sigma 54 modulation/S30EA ribosomal C-terminal domain-containing protein, partial [Hamadaea sp.]|nr:sigma 54 modulation/S30EA ribosomal C-terminal domain-containing protein [Hamadaea sp.]
RGRRAPVSVAAATAGLGFVEPPPLESAVLDGAAEQQDDEPWHIVREKEFSSEPMTIDDALYQMELIGHDFFLFHDKESGRPSVVYRRKAYDYGVITLAP